MILVNGESKHSIEVTDRGFQYGDGLFETIEIRDGQPVFLQQHLIRLQNGCKRLCIPFPDIQLLTEEAYRVIQNSSRAVLKLIITRGIGGRGYRQPEKINPTRVFSLHPAPNYLDSYKKQGINARFCHHRLGHNPFLAGLKHINRLEQILARAEWNDNSIQEGLMLDLNDHVIEGTMSNLFLVKENVIYTPKLDQCGVAGIIRSIILETAAQQELKTEQNTLDRQDVVSADELFVTNSVIGLWPIRRIEQHRFNVGTITRKAITWLEDYKNKDLSACSVK